MIGVKKTKKNTKLLVILTKNIKWLIWLELLLTLYGRSWYCEYHHIFGFGREKKQIKYRSLFFIIIFNTEISCNDIQKKGLGKQKHECQWWQF